MTAGCRGGRASRDFFCRFLGGVTASRVGVGFSGSCAQSRSGPPSLLGGVTVGPAEKAVKMRSTHRVGGCVTVGRRNGGRAHAKRKPWQASRRPGPIDVLDRHFGAARASTLRRFWEGNGKFQCHLSNVATPGHFATKTWYGCLCNVESLQVPSWISSSNPAQPCVPVSQTQPWPSSIPQTQQMAFAGNEANRKTALC
jgi:hypothetical protein